MSCINNFGDINETFIIEAQQVVSADTFVTGFTLSLNNLILTQNRDDQYSAFTVSLSGITGSSTSVSGAYLPLSGGTVTGGTSFISGLTATSLNLTSVIDSNLDTKVLSIDSSGKVNFIYKSAVTASSTANTFTTGATYSVSTGVLTFKRNDDFEYTAGTFNYITGSTQSGNTLTLTSNSGATFTYTPSVLTGSFLPLSGGTVSGNTVFTSGLTATTISATTYLNLPVTADTFVTGFTLSSNTITLTQNISGQYSAFTISLSAYTGSSSVSGAFLPLSGGTVSGNTVFTSGLTATTISATTISGGTFYGNGSNLTGIQNIYTSDGTLNSNRIVTINNNNLLFSSVRTGGTAMQLSVTQTQANAGDTGDVAFDLSYVLSGDNLGTELVTRVFALNSTNQSTGTTVSNMRVFNLAMNTSPDTTTTEFVGVYIENGSAQGNVSNGRGVFINNGLQGDSQVGFNVNQLGGINNTGLLLFTNTIPTDNWGIYARTHKNYFENNVLIGSDIDSGYQLDVTGKARISYSSTGFTDSPLIIKNTNPSAVVSNVISFDCNATGADQPIFMNFAGPNPKGFGFYASDTDITTTPDGAAFQMYKNTSVNFPGSVFFDSGANDNAAIRFRTAVSSGNITDRMIITSNGKVGINTLLPVADLDVTGFGYLGIGTPTFYAGSSHVLEITSSGSVTPLSLIGGSGTVEIWSDNPPPYNLPTTAVMFGAAAPGTPADGDFHFSTFNTATSWVDRVIIKNNTGYVGIATTSITNTLHVSASTNPVRFEGLASATDSNLLTVDSSGVVHTIAVSAISSSSSADTYVTGFTLSSNTITLTQNTAGQFSAFTISLSAYTGGSTTVIGNFLPLSGGTVSGNTFFTSGLTVNLLTVTGSTILASVTANTLTVTGNTRLANVTANTLTVTGNTILASITANTLTVTGNTILASITANTLTVTGNTRLSGVTANTLTVTGNTRLASVTANTLNVTGSTTLSTLTGTSLTLISLTGTTDRVMQVNSGGTVSASIDIISAYIASASTAATLLSNGNNWDIYGVYAGTSITGTSMGQKHYDDNYFYEAVADNSFIRLIRG